MRLKKNMLIAYGIILALGLSVIAISLESPIESQIAFNITTKNPQPNTIPLPNTVCFAKTSTSLLQVNSVGTIIGEAGFDNSPFLTDNPQFTLGNIANLESGKEFQEIGHFLKIRCVNFTTSTNTDDPNAREETVRNQLACEDPNRSNECIQTDKKLQFRPSNIEVEVWAEDKNGKKERVLLQSFSTETKTTQFGKEETLLFVQIPITDALKNMDTGDYQSLLEVRTSGALNMIFVDSPSNIFQYYIGKLDIPTFFELKITDNTIGEETDSSPDTEENEKENEKEEEIIKEKEEIIKKQTNLGTKDVDPGEDPENIILDLIRDFSLDLITFDLEGLQNIKYYGIYAIFFILIVIAIIGSLASKKREYRPYQ